MLVLFDIEVDKDVYKKTYLFNLVSGTEKKLSMMMETESVKLLNYCNCQAF